MCVAVDWFSGLLMICSLIQQQTQPNTTANFKAPRSVLGGCSALGGCSVLGGREHAFPILLPVPEGLLDTKYETAFLRRG